MKNFLFDILAAGFMAGSVYAALPVQTTFTGATPEQTWALSELSTNLPADWSPYEFLVLEFKASSSQRFDLGLDTPEGRHAKRIGPFAGVWVRAAIPLRFYRQPAGNGVDLAATFNQPRSSYWINIHSGSYGPLTNVTGISVEMDHPVGALTLEIRSVALATKDPGDAVLEGKPLVDEFGQYTHVEWPGKARSLDDLKGNWAAEDAALRASPTNRCPYGGFLDTHAKATGFFRVEQVDGRWWFVCPDGHLFYSAGLNGVGTVAGTRVQGREDLFAALPPGNLTNNAPGGRGRALAGSFYTWNLQRRFGDDWRRKWADFTTRRLAAWGFNTVHNWGAPGRTQAEPRVPYAMMLRGWQTGNSIMGMPDVYAEDFAQRVNEAAASQLAPHKEDPYMLGYFIGNEPPWPGRERLLCNAILQGPPSEIQKRLKDCLAEDDTPARRRSFVLAAFQVYVDTINTAVRKHDPNHLNLGIRFGGDPHEDVLKAAKGFDVFSVNIYRYAPSRATLDRIYSLAQRPILIGEFHIGAPTRGLAPGLVQAMNQDERAAGYRYYVEQCAAHPAVIGTHWFQWLDQPVTGRNDGENYNIGFVDVTDQPYPEMVAAAKVTHDRLFEIHSAKTPPTDRRPKASEANGPSSPTAAVASPLAGYELVWFDEFEGAALNTNRWDYWLLGRRRDAVNVTNAVSVGNGELTIQTYTEGGTHYTSMISTAKRYQMEYGRVEARIAWSESPGMWSAFWMQSPTMGRPVGDAAKAGTEIDIVEHRMQDKSGANIDGQGVSNIHWDGYGANHKTAGSALYGSGLNDGYHTYAMEWTSNHQKFYVDGGLVWTFNNTNALSQRSEFLILSSEVDRNAWAGAIPAGGYGPRTSSTIEMKVDWVRVYQKK